MEETEAADSCVQSILLIQIQGLYTPADRAVRNLFQNKIKINFFCLQSSCLLLK